MCVSLCTESGGREGLNTPTRKQRTTHTVPHHAAAHSQKGKGTFLPPRHRVKYLAYTSKRNRSSRAVAQPKHAATSTGSANMHTERKRKDTQGHSTPAHAACHCFLLDRLQPGQQKCCWSYAPSGEQHSKRRQRARAKEQLRKQASKDVCASCELAAQ